MQQAILATPSLALLTKALHDATLKATHLLAALPTLLVTEWVTLLESLQSAAQHRYGFWRFRARRGQAKGIAIQRGVK